ncbi:MAG: toprim domain-containing protein [Methanobrevibacter sp.]|nr:toprim domain-containing protein [Methanobrevibacter sp.]
MSSIQVRDRVIELDIFDTLKKIKSEITNGKLNNIRVMGDSISVPCPFHKDGMERHNSCTIYCGDGDLPAGSFHCFTCSESGNFPKFVGACFDKDKTFGEDWLLENYSYNFVKKELDLPLIDLTPVVEEKHYLDESVLEQFSDYHPYMAKRKLTDDIIKQFDIKYDPLTRSIVFPVRDVNGKISFLTRRSIDGLLPNGARYLLDKGADKNVIYLLYNILKEDIKEVVVCEGQINALTSWSYGHPAIALLGAGTSESQMKVLNSTGIKHYILCYDNDLAGRKGASRFKKFIRKDVFVDDIIMPEGKDINDLSKEEFDNLVYKPLN